MFTGIIEDLGTVIFFERQESGARLRVKTSGFRGIAEGMSISVNGTCLTAVDPQESLTSESLTSESLISENFSADLAPETLARTNLGDLFAGARVNLERPVTPSTFLSGHIVQGHVDATGELVSLDALGDGNYWLKVRVPGVLNRYLVHKGSIAIDGISLTVARLEEGANLETSDSETSNSAVVVGVTIIPHTYANTTLGHAKPGARFNIEVDVLAKHVEKLLAGSYRGSTAP
jgi:riboflavin synthase